MPRTALVPVSVKGPFPGTVNAGDLASNFTALDNVNGNSFPHTGKEVIVIQNSNAGGAQTVTFTSFPDSQSRTGDITAYSIPASGFISFFPGTGNPPGWRQTDGNIYIDCNAATVKALILRLP
jgi:hypothetical protein